MNKSRPKRTYNRATVPRFHFPSSMVLVSWLDIPRLNKVIAIEVVGGQILDVQAIDNPQVECRDSFGRLVPFHSRFIQFGGLFIGKLHGLRADNDATNLAEILARDAFPEQILSEILPSLNNDLLVGQVDPGRTVL